MDCLPDANGRSCVNCGWIWKYPKHDWPKRNCTNPPNLRPYADALGLPDPLPPSLTQTVARYAAGQPLGPGDWLHIEILRWVGDGPTRRCGCEDRIRQMNEWGPQDCREHLDEIVGWLVEQAEKHEWEGKAPKLARLARFMASKVPGGKIPIAVVCKRMLLRAIKKAESNPTATHAPQSSA